MNGTAPLPVLVLWRGDGCHLCDETAELVALLIAERARAGQAAPVVEHRRIADNPAAERDLFEQIPVLEFAGERLPLAIRLGPIRTWLAERLDA